jgi:hypothetical protein
MKRTTKDAKSKAVEMAALRILRRAANLVGARANERLYGLKTMSAADRAALTELEMKVADDGTTVLGMCGYTVNLPDGSRKRYMFTVAVDELDES